MEKKLCFTTAITLSESAESSWERKAPTFIWFCIASSARLPFSFRKKCTKRKNSVAINAHEISCMLSICMGRLLGERRHRRHSIICILRAIKACYNVQVKSTLKSCELAERLRMVGKTFRVNPSPSLLAAFLYMHNSTQIHSMHDKCASDEM